MFGEIKNSNECKVFETDRLRKSIKQKTNQ